PSLDPPPSSYLGCCSNDVCRWRNGRSTQPHGTRLAAYNRLERMRRASLLLLLVAVVLTPLSASRTAQSARRPPRPPPAANRALVEGRFDDVDAAVEKLDLRDPNVAALKARAAIARGRYQDADALLRPIAQRAPTSEAALELGLLERYLGKSSAAPLLEKV